MVLAFFFLFFVLIMEFPVGTGFFSFFLFLEGSSLLVLAFLAKKSYKILFQILHKIRSYKIIEHKMFQKLIRSYKILKDFYKIL